MNNLVNLHTNTEYSILESTIKLSDLIDFAIKNKLKALAITDHNVMYGVPKFLKLTQKYKIKPIIGLDLDVENFRLILLAKNYQGYLELLRLSSLKNYGNKIVVNSINSKNLFVIDHPDEGSFVKNNKVLTIDNYFVGVNKGIHPQGVAIISNQVLHRENKVALQILKSIKTSQILENCHVNEQSGFTITPNNIAPEMIAQANQIADECNIVFPPFKLSISSYPDLNGVSTTEFLTQITQQKLTVMLEENSSLDPKLYQARYNQEMETIKETQLEDYFLIIYDIVKWAKSQQIMIGPGRGSASSSLIVFLLGITKVDPLKYDLFFERFLNTERKNLPDIDIDIQDNMRDRVIEYVFKKYGLTRVAQIITFSTLKAKMALRDTGRALGFLSPDVDVISKLIKATHNGRSLSLKDNYKKSSSLRALINNNDKYQQLYQYALLIENLPRQIGTHPAGLVLAAQKIETIIPVIKNDEGYNQTQFSMEFLEQYGLIKIDFLGLRNLTIISEIQKEIFKNYHKKVNLDKIPSSDRLTNALLTRGDTSGIFQLESAGMRNSVQKIKVNSLDDIIILLALYRPGPMGSIEEYVKRKENPNLIPSLDSSIDGILKSTYGIIIFQEQILAILKSFANLELKSADILRRAISKKNRQLMSDFEIIFFNGAKKLGRNEAITKQIWNLILKFADYGFNKAHAVAYGFISYQMAFLKAHFLIEFYTQLLNQNLHSQQNTYLYFTEIKQSSILIVGPNINSSDKKYINRQGKIYMPLNIIKGMGENSSNLIIEERKTNGKYKSFIDFVVRSKKNGLGNAAVELLIKGNTLKEFGNVSSLLLSLPAAMRFANLVVIPGKDNLNYIDEAIISQPIIIQRKREFKNEFLFEKQLYGFPIFTFPTTNYPQFGHLSDLKQKNISQVVAQVIAIKSVHLETGEILFATLLDETQSLDVSININEIKFFYKIKLLDIYKFTIKLYLWKNQHKYKVVAMEKVEELINE